MEEDPRVDLLNEMPMHYAYHRVNYDCELPDSVIDNEVTKEVKEAKTYEELYTALNEMKTNLEAEETIESVDLMLDVPDVPTDDSEEVMVRMDIHERRGRSLYLICNSTVDENDYSLGAGISWMNPTLRMDVLQFSEEYSLRRGNRIQRLSYSSKYSPFGCPLQLSLQKNYLNRLKESSVKVFSDSLQCSISDRKRRFFLEYGLEWRDLLPHGDRDEQRVLKTQCSESMLKECRPSIKSSIGLRYKKDTEDRKNCPTEGSSTELYLGYNGLIGDVNSIKGEASLSRNIPLIKEIDNEPGFILHLQGYGGFIHNLNRRRTRYADRFFLNSSHIHGMDVRDFGPKSKPEEGGRKGGDVLGGDYCAVLSAGLSLPVIVSHEFSYNIRAKLFYEMGAVWNRSMDKKSIIEAARSAFGMNVLIPVMGFGMLETGYIFNQKRFIFSFTLNK